MLKKLKLAIKTDLESINNELIKAVIKNPEEWVGSQNHRDFYLSRLQKYSSFTAKKPLNFEYIVFDQISNRCHYCKTEEDAEKLVNELVDEHINQDIDGKIGYSKVKKVVREVVTAEKSKFTESEWVSQGRDLGTERYIECVLEDCDD